MRVYEETKALVSAAVPIFERAESGAICHLTSDTPKTLDDLVGYCEEFLKITGLEVVDGSSDERRLGEGMRRTRRAGGGLEPTRRFVARTLPDVRYGPALHAEAGPLSPCLALVWCRSGRERRYSVVLPSKCSSEASAAAFVACTVPSTWCGGP